MVTKLTLKLDKTVIEGAKEYASLQHRSLSGIIEAYLQSLINSQKSEDRTTIEISDFVKSMSSEVNIPVDLDHKAENFERLNEKYK